MSYIKRPPHDDFTFKIFFKLKGRIKKPADYIYTWSAVMDPEFCSRWRVGDEWFEENELYYRNLLTESIKNDLVVIGVKDHLTTRYFNPWTQKKPVIVEYLEHLFNYYDQKNFVLLTSVENLESYINCPNVTIIPWGGDITNQQAEYQSLEPVINKNLDSDVTYLSLNRTSRVHRAVLVSLLYGLNIEQYGLISAMFKGEIDDVIKHANWQFTQEQAATKQCIIDGFDKFQKTVPSIVDDKEIYQTSANDNVFNFRKKLALYYEYTFVDIITETSYTESAYLITEKTLNSIYGCSFPILLCGQGSVEFLRTIGFDMFDDIIDHSYDSITNPVDRMYRAVTDNIELLTNNQRTKQLWADNKHRFLANVHVAKNTMYKFFHDRAITEMDKLKYD